jgi:hypothetical protein
MTSTIRSAAILLTALPMALLAYSVRDMNAAAVQEPQAPAAVWTAFQADLERVDKNSGEVVIRGRVYVDTFGSERRESWAVADESRRVIEIRNQSTGRFCQLLSGGEGAPTKPWKCQPMDVIPNPLRPGGGQDGPAYEGLTTQTFSSPSGTTLVVAPELSWFPLVTEDQSVITRLANIQVTTPEPLLFFPPAEAQIVEVQEKGGRVIVRGK